MKARVPSFHEALFPVDLPEFAAIADFWPEELVNKMLTLVWDGFDQMKGKYLRGFDFTQSIEQLERGLTDLHADEILLLWKQRRDGFESFIPKPEAWEFRSRKNASSMPSSIDIGFVLLANRSIRWSVEGKVLEHPADVRRYLADLNDKYLAGKGAPLAASSALIGYLRRGLPDSVFTQLQARLSERLETCAAFLNRPHRVSHHLRVSVGSNQETPFACHHLILGLSNCAHREKGLSQQILKE